MNTEAPNPWDMANPSLQSDQVLALLRLGLEADEEGDVALDFEAYFRGEAANQETNTLFWPE